MTSLLLPTARAARWVDNFTARHGATHLGAADARSLAGSAEDGSTFRMRLPLDARWSPPPDAEEGLLEIFLGSAVPPEDWGVLLVRKGGFAIARLDAGVVTARKVGQRHVQGRTKAGGQSQQRFARRRDNQAREAFEAAAGHAVRLLGEPRAPLTVVGGGDRDALDAVLADARLAHLQIVEPWLPVPDPRGKVLDQAILDAQCLQVEVRNA